MMEIYLARKQGFCSGVASAIQLVEQALSQYGPPLYVYHDIVHNTFVVEYFQENGVIFVEKLDDVPEGGRLIFSAHGVAPSVVEEAQKRGLIAIDASCPLVKKVHREAKEFVSEGRHVILIGHKGHQEIIGTSGYIPKDKLSIIQTGEDVEKLNLLPEAPVAYLTQTTFSIDETRGIIQQLEKKFKNLVGSAKKDICYATQSRQDAVKELARICDVILICGSPNSSNSNRLRETGDRAGVPSFIIDSAAEMDANWIQDKKRVGISSGASVPYCVVQEVVQWIQVLFPEAAVRRFEDFEIPDQFPYKNTY